MENGLELALADYESNKISLTELQRKYGIDRHIISAELDNRGIKKWGRKITPEIEEEIISTYLQKPKSIKTVAFECKLSEASIIKVLKKRNVPRWSRTKQFSPDLDENFFEKIDNEAKAYFLGLILTDGCLFENPGKAPLVAITLQEQDKYILEKFVEVIHSNKKVTTDGRGCYGIQILSFKMYQDLENLGLTPRKSFSTKLPQIPKELYKHLLRGIIDGDGSIQFNIRWDRPNGTAHQRSIGICSASADFLNEVATFLQNELGIRKPPSNWELEYTSAGQINWYKKEDLIKLIHYLYDDATIFLKRKKEKADLILSEIE